jgi:hypothetical protein
MKKVVYWSGYFSIIGITWSAFMKVYHLPGASLLLIGISLIIGFLFLPTLFIYLYKQDLPKSLGKKMKYYFGFFGILFLVFGTSFQIMHIPGAMLLLGIGLAIINFAFLPMFFYQMYKKVRK